ncbi:MAG TPA: UDP-N-acetylmuramoyl-L-alanyl-D-glutamate--2,6-diaminopimelate ligase [Patescibacteria group bacterium]|nr:UDP-N-acetylmuramoyl-L-alanyl-D-glutamate--2,6-diaminopimelate ligase [Patescibacteria group bacterium]
MIKKIKKIIRALTPSFIIKFYHLSIAYLASFIYGNPSKDLIVIGVTGTAGKSTVVNFIADILKESGKKVGASTTFNFRIGEKEFENKIRMTMPGRFILQKWLYKMKKAGCKMAIIEVTSQGLAQFRHKAINFDLVLFNNISKEHIEAHKGFNNYLKAKQMLFKHLFKMPKKKINGKKIKKTSIVNIDDKHAEDFLKYPADKKYGFSLKESNKSNIEVVQAKEVKPSISGLDFKVKQTKIHLNLLGKFNVYNALAAILVGLNLGLNIKTCKKALEKRKVVPGRMEIVNKKPLICVDQAHTPDELENVYKTLTNIKEDNLILVLGAAGGGRDKWKRPVIGKLAEEYGDIIILTNEDPFWEDPKAIINEILTGIKAKNKLFSENKLFKILNRKKALKKAIDLAGEKDIIAVTGKGSEPCIVEKGKKIPWKDQDVIKDILWGQNVDN